MLGKCIFSGLWSAVVIVADRRVSRGGMTGVRYCLVFRVLGRYKRLNEEGRCAKQADFDDCLG